MQDYVRSANDEVSVVREFEHPEAVDNAEAILALDGIDVAYVGVADLASFMGFTGQIGELDRSVDLAIEKIVAAAKAAGVPLGIHCLTPQAAARRIEQGFRFVAIGGDARYVGGTARETLTEIRRLAVEASRGGRS